MRGSRFGRSSSPGSRVPPTFLAPAPAFCACPHEGARPPHVGSRREDRGSRGGPKLAPGPLPPLQESSQGRPRRGAPIGRPWWVPFPGSAERPPSPVGTPRKERCQRRCSRSVLLHSYLQQMISTRESEDFPRSHRKQETESCLAARPLQSTAGVPASRQPPASRCAASLRPKGDGRPSPRSSLFGRAPFRDPPNRFFICDGGSRC
jgi:hypothetical protein